MCWLERSRALRMKQKGDTLAALCCSYWWLMLTEVLHNYKHVTKGWTNSEKNALDKSFLNLTYILQYHTVLNMICTFQFDQNCLLPIGTHTWPNSKVFVWFLLYFYLYLTTSVHFLLHLIILLYKYSFI